MKIPKKFHQVWLGRKPLPKKFRRYQKSWKKNHKDWEFNVWTEKNLPKDILNLDCLELCNNYSEMSDVLRYSLLYWEKGGGIYLDVDFRNFKPIDPLINDLDIFISTEDNHHLCGGFIGAVPGHPLIKRLIDLIPNKLKSTMSKSSDHRIGPRFISQNISWDEINVLPKEYFYPYLPGQQFKRDTFKNKGIAYASHEWAGSWLKNPKQELVI